MTPLNRTQPQSEISANGANNQQSLMKIGKAAGWLGLFVPFVFHIYLFVTGRHGVQPAESLSKSLGFITMIMLVINLYIGVLISFIKPFPTPLRWLLVLRRPLGVATMIYAILHFGFFVIKQGGLEDTWSEILHAVYLWAGSLGLVIMILLGFTSNNMSVRWLSYKKWKQLHRWVYICFFASGFHYFLIEKSSRVTFSILFFPLVVLLLTRFFRSFRIRNS